ncbi:MAG: PEP-CTERM sorting domain-containing protein, partial [Burkholderiales bacterium]
LDVNTAGYSGTGSFLDQVAVKVSSSLFASSLFSAPSGTANWLLVDGGINASGCSGSGSGFLCANSDAALNSGKGVSVPDGTYSWVFDLTVDNGTLFTDLNEASVKGRFVDSAGAKVGDLVSENVTLLAVPEPEIYAMLGIGLALMGFVGRRRKQAAA